MKSRVTFVVVCLLGLSLLFASCGGSSPVSPATAYVAHSQSHSLSVVSIPANKTVSNIEIGNSSYFSATTTASYPTGVAVTPDGSRAYVTDAVTFVWVVDTASNSVITRIAAGSGPEAIAITPDGKSAYVTTITCSAPSCPNNPPPMASVEVIDTTSNSVTTTINIGALPTVQKPGALLAGSIAISPDGTRAYVANGQGNQIWAIDTASNQVVATIPTTELGFVGVSISPDGSRLYAASIGNPSVVEVIDTKTNTVATTIALPDSDVPTRIAVTPDGSHAYITAETGHVWIIDTATNAVRTIGINDGQPLLDVAFTPDGTRAYVTCGNNNTIYVLNTASSQLVSHFTSSYPGGLAISRPM